MPDKLTKEEVLKLAELARLELTEAEVVKYQSDLTSILGYLATLQQMPQESEVIDSEPQTELVLRPDEVREFSDPAALITSSQGASAGAITVPAVFSETPE